MAAAHKSSDLRLAGCPIVVPAGADETLRWAGLELARGLGLITGVPSALAARPPARGGCVRLESAGAAAAGAAAAACAAQAYRVRAECGAGERWALRVAAPSSAGVLYGVYGLLEHLGMGFYAGGETLPDLPAPARVRADLELAARPAFAVRGQMLHYNFLCGCTCWGADDYRFYFDQLARMRNNLLLIHWYDSEPGAAYDWRGAGGAGGRTPNSLSKPWGALAALHTDEFAFGAGRAFDAAVFSSPMGADRPDLLTEIRRTERVLADAWRYARGAGIQIAAGFEAPSGDPTDRATLDRFRARLHQFLERNPHLTHFALWQHESGGCFGSKPPAEGPARRLLEAQRPLFAHLGNERRVWEAVRYGRFAAAAAAVLAREAPHLRLVLVGWGGDRWMRFADLCLGYDKLLPPGVIFTCHDNIDASFGPAVSAAWGELPPERERWAMPWIEGDIDECWVRQPNVESLGVLLPDARAKGAQGLLTLQWRTRGVEEELSYAARFAWDPTLTPEGFYQLCGRDALGPARAAEGARLIGALQRAGSRWTGVRGTVECGVMKWHGFQPPFPYDVDASVPDYFLAMAKQTADVLAMVPPAAEDAESGAYHLRSDEDRQNVPRDPGRPGVAEMTQIVRRLEALRGVADEARLRAELTAIREAMWDLRVGLIRFGMSGLSYRTYDLMLIALHHVVRNAGARRKLPALRRHRAQVARLRRACAVKGRRHRLARWDYLADTMDFVLHYDPVAMLLATDQPVDRAIKAAAAAAAAGDAAGADDIAWEAYARLTEAGLPRAVDALVRKALDTCERGVLATFSVKALPLYWDAIGALESCLRAPPPRAVCAAGQAREVWLSWEPAPKAEGQALFRRRAGGGTAAWRPVRGGAALAGACRLFVDRAVRPGAYEYAVASLDAEGRAGPLSHAAAAVCGAAADAAPRILAAAAAARWPAGEDRLVRAVVLSTREPVIATLCARPAGAPEWRRHPMLPSFGAGWVGRLPGGELAPGVLEWYIEARDAEGAVTTWPAAAREGAPATAGIV